MSESWQKGAFSVAFVNRYFFLYFLDYFQKNCDININNNNDITNFIRQSLLSTSGYL